jgi:hypothetical protein
MTAYLSQAIMEIVERSGEQGASMGAIVDKLTGEGFEDKSIEAEVWAMLGSRRLTPFGYICRKVRRRGDTGEWETIRAYEFLLVPWSRDLDNQLDLGLPVGEPVP